MTELKLNLGCGRDKKDGFIGVDTLNFGQDIVADLREPWKWDDNSVDEVYCAHFLEHLTQAERTHFVNELYRVLKPGAQAEIVVPHWTSDRAYGDPTHQWPPVVPFWFHYLSRPWREACAPHTCSLYTCDFRFTSGPSLDEDIKVRNHEFQAFASRYYVNACEDLYVTLVKVGGTT